MCYIDTDAILRNCTWNDLGVFGRQVTRDVLKGNCFADNAIQSSTEKSFPTGRAKMEGCSLVEFENGMARGGSGSIDTVSVM